MVKIAVTALVLTAGAICAQFEGFEVATIRPSPPGTLGRYTRMQGGHQFVAKNCSIKFLVGAAYDLNPRMISGGPAWTESDHYDILAVTPGEKQPSVAQQMIMLQGLLADRMKLNFHREVKEMPIYSLSVARTGSKLKASAAPPEDQPNVLSTVFPAASGGIDHVLMPAHNATMTVFVSVLQRGILDRPVVDNTGLTGRYDFDLEWAPDETQFGGELSPGVPDHAEPDLFAALDQLGLRLEKTRGPVQALVIDHVERPSAN